MKKQIQLYYDPEDETYKTLISAKNKTYLLDVCYKFSVEFYKCQMKEVNPDSEEVICYLIAMMYLLRQGGSLPGIAARGAGGTGEWLWGRTYQPKDMHQSADSVQPIDMRPSAGIGQSAGMHLSSGPGQPMGMHLSAGPSQLMDMHLSPDKDQLVGMYPSADMQSAGIHQSTDLQSSDMERLANMPADSRYQAEDGHKGAPGNWQAGGNPALASVMADVEIK